MIPGFVDAKTVKTKDRLIISVSGLEKCGKTHFSLTAPPRIALFSTDMGEEGVIDKFDKPISIMYLGKFDREDPDVMDQASEEFRKFRTAYLQLLRGQEVRTIVWDTATEIWELLRIARFGRATQIMPYQYGPINAEYRGLIREAFKYDKDVILLHKMRPVYIDDKRTGRYERSGFADTGFLVQLNARIRYDSDEKVFVLRIEDYRHNPFLAGEEFSGPLCDFTILKSMVLG